MALSKRKNSSTNNEETDSDDETLPQVRLECECGRGGDNNYTEFHFDNELPSSFIITIKQLDRKLKDKYYFNYCA
ncbi:unnamed protein product [Rotaria sp. Silwood1]|nr:unnamed protein product [Rotaria sp. Silwood1]